MESVFISKPYHLNTVGNKKTTKVMSYSAIVKTPFNFINGNAKFN